EIRRGGVRDAGDEATGHARDRRDLLATRAADLPAVEDRAVLVERGDERVVAAARGERAIAELHLAREEAGDDDAIADRGDAADAVEVWAADQHRVHRG